MRLYLNPIDRMRRSVLRGVIPAVVLAGAATFTWPASAEWEMVVCADSNALPFSNEEEAGFENRIAEILAEELDATVRYLFSPQRLVVSTGFLREGDCDVVLGVADGTDIFLTTVAYYRSPYVFVQRSGEAYTIQTFDDAVLHDLRIAVMPSDSPAHHALLRRGLGENVILESLDFVASGENAFEEAIGAVADGTVDVAVVWGPPGGYFATKQSVELTVTPVPLFDPPFIPMYINMVAGVRHGDEYLRDLLDIAIVARWDDIQALLVEMDIPRMDLVAPILTLELPE